MLLFGRYGVSVKNHIQQGICLPLDVKHDLVKNVTVVRRGLCACSHTSSHALV